MSNNSCRYETLVHSKYCRLSLCRDCGVINVNLPYRISLQFGVSEFLEIADAFGIGAQQIRTAKNASLNIQENVIALKKVIH